MSILRTHPAFTRTGSQCAVCNAWKMPCPRCRVAPAAVISEEMLLRTLIGTEYPVADEMATDIVRTGPMNERVNRARRALGLVEVSQDLRAEHGLGTLPETRFGCNVTQ